MTYIEEKSVFFCLEKKLTKEEEFFSLGFSKVLNSHWYEDCKNPPKIRNDYQDPLKIHMIHQNFTKFPQDFRIFQFSRFSKDCQDYLKILWRFSEDSKDSITILLRFFKFFENSIFIQIFERHRDSHCTIESLKTQNVIYYFLLGIGHRSARKRKSTNTPCIPTL